LESSLVDPVAVDLANLQADDEGLMRFAQYNPFNRNHNFGILVVGQAAYNDKKSWLVEHATAYLGSGAWVLPHASTTLRHFTKSGSPAVSTETTNRAIDVSYESLTSRVGGDFNSTSVTIKEHLYSYVNETDIKETHGIQVAVSDVIKNNQTDIDAHFVSSSDGLTLPIENVTVDFWVDGMKPESVLEILFGDIPWVDYDMYLTFGGVKAEVMVTVTSVNSGKYDLDIYIVLDDLTDYNFFRGRVFSQKAAINSIGFNPSIGNNSGEIFYSKLELIDSLEGFEVLNESGDDNAEDNDGGRR